METTIEPEMEDMTALIQSPQIFSFDFDREDFSKPIQSTLIETTDSKIEGWIRPVPSPQIENFDFETEDLAASIPLNQKDPTDSVMEEVTEPIRSPQIETADYEIEDSTMLMLLPQKETIVSVTEDLTEPVSSPQIQPTMCKIEDISRPILSPERATIDSDAQDITQLGPPQIEETLSKIEDRTGPMPSQKETIERIHSDIQDISGMVPRQRKLDTEGVLPLPLEETTDSSTEDTSQTVSEIKTFVSVMEDINGAKQLGPDIVLLHEPVQSSHRDRSDDEDLFEFVPLPNESIASEDISDMFPSKEDLFEPVTSPTEDYVVYATVKPSHSVPTTDETPGSVPLSTSQKESTFSSIQDLCDPLPLAIKDTTESHEDDLYGKITVSCTEKLNESLANEESDLYDTHFIHDLVPSPWQEIDNQSHLLPFASSSAATADNETCMSNVEDLPGSVSSPYGENIATDLCSPPQNVDEISQSPFSEPLPLPHRQITESEIQESSQSSGLETSPERETLLLEMEFPNADELSDTGGPSKLVPLHHKVPTFLDLGELSLFVPSLQKEVSLPDTVNIADLVVNAEDASTPELSPNKDMSVCDTERFSRPVRARPSEDLFDALSDELCDPVTRPNEEITVSDHDYPLEPISWLHSESSVSDTDDLLGLVPSEPGEKTSSDKEVPSMLALSPHKELHFLDTGLLNKALQGTEEISRLMSSPPKDTPLSDSKDLAQALPTKETHTCDVENIFGQMPQTITECDREDISESASPCQQTSLSDIEIQPLPVSSPHQNILLEGVSEIYSNERNVSESAPSPVKMMVPDTEDTCKSDVFAMEEFYEPQPSPYKETTALHGYTNTEGLFELVPNMEGISTGIPLPDKKGEAADAKESGAEVVFNPYLLATEDRHLHTQLQKKTTESDTDSSFERLPNVGAVPAKVPSLHQKTAESDIEDSTGSVPFSPLKTSKESESGSERSSLSSKGDFSEPVLSSLKETTMSDAEDLLGPIRLLQGESPIFHIPRPATMPPPREERRKRRRAFCLRIPDQNELKLPLKSVTSDIQSFPCQDHQGPKPEGLCDELVKMESKGELSPGQTDQECSPILPKTSAQKQKMEQTSMNVSSTSSPSDHFYHKPKKYQGIKKNEPSPKAEIKPPPRPRRGHIVDQQQSSSSTIKTSKSGKDSTSKVSSDLSKKGRNRQDTSSPVTPPHKKVTVSCMPQPERPQGPLHEVKTVRHALPFTTPNQKEPQLSPYAARSAYLPKMRQAPSKAQKPEDVCRELREKERKGLSGSKTPHQRGPLAPPPKEKTVPDKTRPGPMPPARQRKKTTRPSFTIRVPDQQSTVAPRVLSKTDVCGALNEQRKGSQTTEESHTEPSQAPDKTSQKQVKGNKSALKSVNFPPIHDSHHRQKASVDSWCSDTKITEEKPMSEIHPLSPYRTKLATPVPPTAETRSQEIKKNDIEPRPEIQISSSPGEELLINQDPNPLKAKKFTSLADKRKELGSRYEIRGQYKPKGGVIVDRELEPLRPKTHSRRNVIGRGSAIRTAYRPRGGPIVDQDQIPMRSRTQPNMGSIQKGLGLGSIRCPPDKLKQETIFDPLTFKSECRSLGMKQNEPVSVIQPYRRREDMLFDNTMLLRTKADSKTTDSRRPTFSTANRNATMPEAKKTLQMANMSLAASSVTCSNCGHSASFIQCRQDVMIGCQTRIPRPPSCRNMAGPILKKIAMYPPQRLITCKMGSVETDIFKQLKYAPARTF
ncbi:uncharacterized protein LOC109511680 [Hippocampus comes]|uniref:uncharacterized protein LOC109511680 n=1 Tax=Hippocampus comes TaxID=109280 RepID=UPI00094EE10E|nr:PREDICTED: uncharacterized protein LOC109511680 [Hippocampus comes]